MAYRGRFAECPSCQTMVPIPEAAPPLSLGYAVTFFAVSLGLELGILTLMLIFVGLLYKVIAPDKLLFVVGIAAPLIGLVGGALLGWVYARQNGPALNDWVTNGDPLIALLGRTDLEIIPGHTTSTTSKSIEPAYDFRPGQWGMWGGLFVGFVGFLGGLSLGAADALQTTEKYEGFKSIAIGTFGGMLFLGLLGYIFGFIAGTIRDLSGGLSENIEDDIQD